MAEGRSKTGYELHIKNIKVLSKPHEISPIVINQKIVDTSIENLLDYRPITLRNEKKELFLNYRKAFAGGLENSFIMNILQKFIRLRSCSQEQKEAPIYFL